MDTVQINYELDSQQIVEKPAKADSEITMLEIGQFNVFNGKKRNLGSQKEILKSEDETVTDNSNIPMIDSIPNFSNDEQDKSVKSQDHSKKLLGKRNRKMKEKKYKCKDCPWAF